MDKSKFAVTTYNKIASKYTKLYFNDKTDLPFIKNFLRFLPENAKILDVGCGPGTFTKRLYDQGFQVEGIDFSPQMLKLARVKVPEVKFKLMDMRKLRYKDETFNGLLVAYSLIHIPGRDLKVTLEGFYRVLKKDGFAMLIVWEGKGEKVIEEPLKKGEKMFIKYFTVKELQKNISEIGFKTEYLKVNSVFGFEEISKNVIYLIARKV